MSYGEDMCLAKLRSGVIVGFEFNISEFNSILSKGSLAKIKHT